MMYVMLSKLNQNVSTRWRLSEPITSAPVQDQMESKNDQVQDPDEHEPECLNKIETVESITSAPVRGRHGEYE